MSYLEAKTKYAALGVDTDAAIAKLKTVPVSLHCWQGDDVRGFDTDPSKPLTGGIQTTGNYPGRARTPEELMADLDMVLKLCPGTKKMNLHASYAIFEDGEWADRDKLEPKHFKKWSPRSAAVQARPVTSSRIRRIKKSSAFMGLVLQQGSANDASTMAFILCHTSWGLTPASESVAGSFSSRRSRISPFFRFRTATVSALPPMPADLASAAYFAPATWALQDTTDGSKMAFSRPWGTWNIPPRLCAMAWQSPNPAWVKAIPAMVAAV